MKTPIFIVLEGIEGVGKTTQIHLLEAYFKAQKTEYITTREPGGLEVSEAIRKIILNKEMSPITELLLYEAARSEHMDKIIKPALKNGKTVICDRFALASVAYQGYGRGLDLDLINTLNTIATQNIEPDITIILDIEVADGFKRVNARGNEQDRIEKSGNEFFSRVRNGYLETAKKYPDKIKVVSAYSSIEDIHKQIISLL